MTGAPVFLLPADRVGGTELVARFLYDKFSFIDPATSLVIWTHDQLPDLAGRNNVRSLGRVATWRVALLLPWIAEVRQGRPLLVFQAGIGSMVCALRGVGLVRSKVVVRSASVLSMLYGRRLPVLRWLISFLLRRADLHICQSAAIRNDLIDRWGVASDRAVVIPNPLTRSTHTSQPAVVSESPFAVVVGNLRPEKGHVRLVEHLAQIGFPHDLVIIGRGVEEEAIRAVASRLGVLSRLRFVTDCLDPLSYIAGAEVLYCSSYYEGYPNAVLEAAMLGKPVVGFSDCAVLHEMLTHRINGFLVAPGDTAALNDAIQSVRDGFSPDWTALLARHDPQVVVGQYWNAISGICGT